ncbi:MAG TPA: o-succinylbenzoate synthase [Pyrinomonadaceae bacterium]|nr:o-succinylbenzoate synthase [Pyrinomonadaceae bacterium]
MKTEVQSIALTVKHIALHRVRVPLKEPFRISNGSIDEKDSILVEVTTGEGVTGWGEASPMSGSFYSDDTPEGAWRALREQLIPLALEGKGINVPRFFERLREVPGEPFAKAGLEGALWDAHARSFGAPLHELLGATSKPIPSGVAIGIYDTVDELLERVESYVGEGYRRVKIKIQPGWDVEPVAAVRTKFPHLPLTVDANAAYTLGHADVFRQLDAYNLVMIEQPLARGAHRAAAELQRRIRTPVCADESAESIADLEEIIAKGAARIINIKVQRVGGLSEARLMLERTRSAGLGCWVGTMPELGVASAQGLHFAALEGFDYPTDIEASARWFVDDVIEPLIRIDAQGFIHLPEGAGIGFKIAREKIERYAVAHGDFAAS